MTRNKPKRKITPKQVGAIRLARKLGERIAMEHPHIAQDYRSGKTMVGIIGEYNFSEVYGSHSIRVMKEAMRSALEKLIPAEELEILAREHRQNWGIETLEKGIGVFSITSEERTEISRRVGNKTYEERLGIYSMTLDQKVAAGRKGGKIGGKKLYEMGLGVHALTLEEKREAGRKAALARGQKPFSDEEKEYFLDLCKNQEYQYVAGEKNVGRPNYQLISDELERKFGIKRTTNSLKQLKYQLGTKRNGK